jgi:HK97 family phage prohead protease
VTVLHRFNDGLHLRLDGEGDGRTVHGIAVPFDTPTPIRDAMGTYEEVFTRGSFSKTLQERGSRVKLLAHHDRQRLLGGRPRLWEDDDGLHIEARIAATRDGNDILELVREGALDSFSIGFSPDVDDWSDDRSSVTRRAVRLHEVSLVPFPAYDGAVVAGVRTSDDHPEPGAGEEAAVDADQEVTSHASQLIAVRRRLFAFREEA